MNTCSCLQNTDYSYAISFVFSTDDVVSIKDCVIRKAIIIEIQILLVNLLVNYVDSSFALS